MNEKIIDKYIDLHNIKNHVRNKWKKNMKRGKNENRKIERTKIRIGNKGMEIENPNK